MTQAIARAFVWPQYLDQFSQLLRDPQRAGAQPGEWLAGLVSQPGFAVYRNTFLKACVDALQGNYPAIARLVGEEWFRAAAAHFVLATPPSEPMLSRYGAGFEEFLAGFEPAREISYLPAIARLDRAWTEAHLAADAATLTLADLGAIAPDHVSDLKLRPHPATRWFWCDDIPAYSIWSANREHAEPQSPPEWNGEGTLLTRPEGQVLWRQVSRNACRLLDACATGMTLESAAQTALHDVAQELRAPALSSILAELIAAGAFAGLANAQ